MLNIKSILIPLDLSDHSKKLIMYGRSLAETYGAELHLLHVVRVFEPYQGVDYIPGPNIYAAQEELMNNMNQTLNQFVGENFPESPRPKTTLAGGNAAREILRYIEENDISLVVMGTHGRRGLDKVVFGSVAQRVVQESPAPVLTIKPDSAETEA